MTVLGVVLIVLGVVALVAGIGGGIAAMLRGLRTEAQGQDDTNYMRDLESLVKAVTEFLRTASTSPQWIVLVVIGVGLVAWGGSLL